MLSSEGDDSWLLPGKTADPLSNPFGRNVAYIQIEFLGPENVHRVSAYRGGRFESTRSAYLPGAHDRGGSRASVSLDERQGRALSTRS